MSYKLIEAHVRTSEVLRRALGNPQRQRGDVPGWVLITIMTAAVVGLIWGIAQDRLPAMFQDAIDGVSPGGG